MTPPHPNPAGEVVIRVDPNAPPAQRFQVRSLRPTSAARLFVGRSLVDTVAAIPRLFSVCGGAQAVAALAACEQGAGLSITPQTAAARGLLLRVEAIREHLWRLAIDWPSALGLPPQPALVAEAVAIDQRLRRQLAPALRLGGLDIGEAPELPAALPALVKRFAASDLGRDAIPNRIAELGWANPGRIAVQRLAERPLHTWHTKLSDDGADSFAAQPAFEQVGDETGALARLADSPKHAGLHERWLARRAELDRLLTARVVLRCEAGSPQTGVGLAVVDAARGTLVHQVKQAGGQVRDYRIVAPTEWNFHPDGPLARALRTLEDSDPKAQTAQIGALVTAIDPCVAWRLEWDSAHA